MEYERSADACILQIQRSCPPPLQHRQWMAVAAAFSTIPLFRRGRSGSRVRNFYTQAITSTPLTLPTHIRIRALINRHSHIPIWMWLGAVYRAETNMCLYECACECLYCAASPRIYDFLLLDSYNNKMRARPTKAHNNAPTATQHRLRQRSRPYGHHAK